MLHLVASAAFPSPVTLRDLSGTGKRGRYRHPEERSDVRLAAKRREAKPIQPLENLAPETRRAGLPRAASPRNDDTPPTVTKTSQKVNGELTGSG